MPDPLNVPLDSTAATAAREAWERFPSMLGTSIATRGMSAGNATEWGLGGAVPQSTLPPISLGGGIPDAETQPRAELLAAMGRVLEQPGDAALVYGGAQGFEPLRDEMAQYFARNHPGQPDADWYLLTNGAAGAIEAICASFLDPGDVVITEIPTFAGSLRTIRGKQASVVGVGMDDEGIRLDELEATIDRLEAAGEQIKLIYTQPTFHNPTGLTMTLQRRLDLIEVAARRQILLMEDHAYSELYFGEPPPPTLSELTDGWGVLTVGTFSKVIATGLRVGWVQARPDWIQAMVPARFDMGNSPLLHRMLHEYMVRGDFREHVERMRQLYALKAKTLAGAIEPYGEPYFDLIEPSGGFFLWLKLRNGLTGDGVRDAASVDGLNFPSGKRFYPGADPGDDGESIRLAYSWPPATTLEEAAERLGRAFHRAANGG
ncbi:MAG: PLP-dependent aminotransferase family protein [Chloroflexota bacterium]|nr:PLP-dependent aminotransferase family protein [Chloroflexota bacterium]MDE2891085.1 PLP-dependent aminotransferase family protein [Chloroflexota bacterium]